MKISEILNCFEEFELCITKRSISNFDVCALCHDSREVVPGALFFALPGTRTHGARFVRQAIKSGAVCIVTEQFQNVKIPQIVVKNAREAMSLAAKHFYGDAADKMKVVAIVGTNGKTTCAHMLAGVLGGSTGVVGTLGVYCAGERVHETLDGKKLCAYRAMTTPDPIELHQILADLKARGAESVIMEVSAHAIHFRKLAGIVFEAAIFTNITQDHLDFFGTFENYCNTKIGFFLNDKQVKCAVVNRDSEFGARIIEARRGAGYEARAYSCNGLVDLQLFANRSVFKLGDTEFTINIPARFNVCNALGCIEAARYLGVGDGQIAKALCSSVSIPGRFNSFDVDGRTVIVDYAHTPDGLEKIIIAARETKCANIITVFGCGGNRDKEKRPLMGEIAASRSDFVVITSDNPRDEKPSAIIKQIEKGARSARKQNYHIIEQRADAIVFALGKAERGDVVIIAGKGGEEFTEVRGKRIEYSDERVVMEYIESIQNANDNVAGAVRDCEEGEIAAVLTSVGREHSAESIGRETVQQTEEGK